MTTLPSAGVRSSFRYSICLLTSVGRIYRVDYFGCGYCVDDDYCAYYP